MVGCGFEVGQRVRVADISKNRGILPIGITGTVVRIEPAQLRRSDFMIKIDWDDPKHNARIGLNFYASRFEPTEGPW